MNYNDFLRLPIAEARKPQYRHLLQEWASHFPARFSIRITQEATPC